MTAEPRSNAREFPPAPAQRSDANRPENHRILPLPKLLACFLDADGRHKIRGLAHPCRVVCDSVGILNFVKVFTAGTDRRTPMPNPAQRHYFRYHFRGWFCATVKWTIVTYISFFRWRKMNTGKRVLRQKELYVALETSLSNVNT